MATIVLDSENLPIWEANIKEMELRQPGLAARLKEWADANGHSFEHDETATPAGTWVSGLTPEPFFQPAELSGRPWRRGEEKNVSLIFVYGTGISSWLLDIVRAASGVTKTSGILVLEPNISILAYLLHTTRIYESVPKGCRLLFAVEAGESAMEEAFLLYADSAKAWVHPGEAEAFRESFAVMQRALRARTVNRLRALDGSAEAVLLDFRRIAMAAPWIAFSPSLEEIPVLAAGSRETPAGKWLTGEILRAGTEDREDAARQVLEKIETGMDSIKAAREKLETVEEEMERASAAALPPRQRTAIAAKMFAALDELHNINPVTGFIGRSRMALSAAAVSGARRMEDVFAVAEWKRIHEGIIMGHRAALDFMETWLKYAAVAVEKVNACWDQGYSIEPLPSFPSDELDKNADFKPCEQDLMVAEALEQLKKLSEAVTPEEALNAHVLIDNLIARADHKWWYLWDKCVDWKLALALEQEGRIAEAGVFIRRMEDKGMRTFGLPHDAGVAFLKDAARIVSSDDMCHTPDFDLARVYAQNALELEPDDEEAARVLREVNAGAVNYYAGKLAAEPKNTPQSVWHEWNVERSRAAQAISGQNLPEAFDIVWSMIKKFARTVPQGAADYLKWLTEHIAKAESAGLRFDNVPGIKREILEWTPLFGEVGIEAPGQAAEESAPD